jgi:hypothetical protein
MANSPASIREVVAKQRTPQHSVAALLRAVTSQIYATADGAEGASVALADDIAANPHLWADAVFQNTPLASDITSMNMDMAHVPAGMEDTFVPPGVRAANIRAEQAKAADVKSKAEADKAKTDADAKTKADTEAKTQPYVPAMARQAAPQPQPVPQQPYVPAT